MYVSCRSGTEENTYGIILAILIQIFLIASQINITVYASMNDMGSKRACTATGAVSMFMGSSIITPTNVTGSSGNDLDYVQITIVSIQSSLAVIAIILAIRLHSQFGWRTFSKVAGYRVSLEAYRALQLARASLEWCTYVGHAPSR